MIHGLLSTICNVIDGVGQRGKKSLIVCLTKADRMWGDTSYGPLALKDPTPFPTAGSMGEYVGGMNRRSKEIGRFIRQEYGLFYNTAKTYFRDVQYCAVSALGSEPTAATSAPKRSSGLSRELDGGSVHPSPESADRTRLGEYAPYRIFDPVLWLWKQEGWL